MVSLEQVKLLESKVSRTIDYVKKVTEENAGLKEKLDSYQKRIDELEVLIQRFKEDQSRIEDGILSALDRLNQFEDALESKLSMESKSSTESIPSAENKSSGGNKVPGEGKIPAKAKTNGEGKIEISTPNPDTGSGGELDIF